MDSITKLTVTWQKQKQQKTEIGMYPAGRDPCSGDKETASYNWEWAFISKFKEHIQDIESSGKKLYNNVSSVIIFEVPKCCNKY